MCFGQSLGSVQGQSCAAILAGCMISPEHLSQKLSANQTMDQAVTTGTCGQQWSLHPCMLTWCMPLQSGRYAC